MADRSFSESLDRLKESFLWAAAQGGNSQDCQSLLEIGADINWRSPEGDTPLLAACRRGHTDTIALLIVHGADSNIFSDKDSMAPIHICARRGDIGSLNVLLDANTSTTIKTKEGHTALDIAKSKGYEDIYARLMRQRRPINNNNNNISAVQSINRLMENSERVTTPRRRELPSVLDPRINNNNNSNNSNRESEEIRKKLDVDKLIDSVKEIKFDDDSTQNHNNNNKIKNKTSKNTVLESQKQQQQQQQKEYSIMGQTISSESDETTIALRKFLDQETSSRKAAEAKLEIFRDQNSQLLKELTSLTQQVTELTEDNYQLEFQLNRMMGSGNALDNISLEECDQIEKNLKTSLERIEAKKNVLMRDQIDSQKEQRLCVICQERDKSVVLLPCRHMCLCELCSSHDQLNMCPLCRQPIAHKIGVFA